jgi:C4-dicarboxylate-specific signal transduction histidine kinase
VLNGIFWGTNAGDIPFYQPTKFELYINPKVAMALSLTLPATLLDRSPSNLQEVRDALAAAVKDADRVGAIVGRMRALMRKSSPRLDRVDMNEALQKVIELTRGEALKNGVAKRLDEERWISRYSCRLLRAEYPNDEGPYRPAPDR